MHGFLFSVAVFCCGRSSKAAPWRKRKVFAQAISLRDEGADRSTLRTGGALAHAHSEVAVAPNGGDTRDPGPGTGTTTDPAVPETASETGFDVFLLAGQS
ncbi:hypothetical protein, partial [Variovorax paradoxus]|uniref:hypothetical protein n=1 Tax=Variovorax paradoxus TaxID=34073 RepID=UPI001ABC233B